MQVKSHQQSFIVVYKSRTLTNKVSDFHTVPSTKSQTFIASLGLSQQSLRLLLQVSDSLLGLIPRSHSDHQQSLRLSLQVSDYYQSLIWSSTKSQTFTNKSQTLSLDYIQGSPHHQQSLRLSLDSHQGLINTVSDYYYKSLTLTKVSSTKSQTIITSLGLSPRSHQQSLRLLEASLGLSTWTICPSFIQYKSQSSWTCTLTTSHPPLYHGSSRGSISMAEQSSHIILVSYFLSWISTY